MKKNFTLNKFLCERKGLLAAFSAVTVVVAVAAPLKSYILQWLIDSGSQGEAVRYLMLGIGIVLVSHAAEYLSRRTFHHMAVRGITKSRERLMQCYAKKIARRCTFRAHRRHALHADKRPAQPDGRLLHGHFQHCAVGRHGCPASPS